MASADFADMRSKLDRLALRGESYLRRYALCTAVEVAAPGAITALLFVPGLFVVATLYTFASAKSIWPMSDWQTCVATIVFAAGYFVVRAAFEYFARPIDRRVALALFDRELNSKDRILAADEFSFSATPSGFQAAAIIDAVGYVDKALTVRLGRVEVAGPNVRINNWLHGGVAAGILSVGLLLGGNALFLAVVDGPHDAHGATSDSLVAAEVEADTAIMQTERQEMASKAEPHRQQSSAPVDRVSEASADPLRRSSEVSGSEPSPDLSGASGGASRQNRSDSAKSNASGQESSSQTRNSPDTPTSRKPKKPNQQSPFRPVERNEPSSGMAGGMGSSSGSKTSSSDNQVADNKGQRDESESDVYDDAEDEEDEVQEAAAAARPLLNERKAPVDRSLSPSGAGSGEANPSANGRSGPGGLKKTRGVAAMLLGVPMPDQLKGQASPGRMKIQRERAEPEEKHVAELVAENRGAIDGTTGRFAHQGLAPWLRSVVRDYFLTERRQSSTESE